MPMIANIRGKMTGFSRVWLLQIIEVCRKVCRRVELSEGIVLWRLSLSALTPPVARSRRW